MLHHPTPPSPREVPTWLLAVVPAVGWAAMFAVNIVLLVIDNPPSPGLHSLFGWVLLVVTVLAYWVHDRQELRRRQDQLVDRVCQHVTREATNLYRTMCRTQAQRDAPTEPILRVVGTAAVVVPQQAVEAAPAPVVDMPSAATVAAMRRLAAKVTGAE